MSEMEIDERCSGKEEKEVGEGINTWGADRVEAISLYIPRKEILGR
jgi:hypothetical protein